MLLVSLGGMQINDTCIEPHTLSLRSFKLFFQRLHWFSQLRSCFIEWDEKERRITLHINNGCHETLNLLHVVSCKIFTFCDVLHETKQKTQTNSQECTLQPGNHLLKSCHIKFSSSRVFFPNGHLIRWVFSHRERKRAEWPWPSREEGETRAVCSFHSPFGIKYLASEFLLNNRQTASSLYWFKSVS